MDIEFLKPPAEELLKLPEKNLTCIFAACGKVFKHRPSLNMHLSQTHGLKSYGTYGHKLAKVSKSLYLCPVDGCSRSSRNNPVKSMKLLKQHYVNVHARRDYLCQKCGRKYVTEKDLNVHVEACGKSFVCSVCHTPYTTREGLRVHQRSQHNAAFKYAQQILKDVEGKSNKKLILLADGIQGSRFNPTSSSCNELNDSNDSVGATSRDKNASQLNLPVILPKPPSDFSTSQKTSSVMSMGLGCQHRESCGTQTDLLQKVVQVCDIGIGPTSSTSRTLSDASLGFKQHMPGQSLRRNQSFEEFYGTPTFNHGVAKKGQNSCCTQSQDDYSTNWMGSFNNLFATDASQTDLYHAGVSNYSTSNTASGENTDFGTQTTLSMLLDDIQHSSIELQCDMETILPSHGLTADVSTLGTQTIQSFGDATPSAELQSLGTQTIGELQSSSESQTNFDLDFTDSNLHQSTSDFAMQFPYEPIAAQTSPAVYDRFTNDLYLPAELELPMEKCNKASATFSQSATQTDLDIFINNIETQTDFNL